LDIKDEASELVPGEAEMPPEGSKMAAKGLLHIDLRLEYMHLPPELTGQGSD
jgi:hypothetical protein